MPVQSNNTNIELNVFSLTTCHIIGTFKCHYKINNLSLCVAIEQRTVEVVEGWRY